MRLLAVDTATPCCSVVLAEDGDLRTAAVDASGVTHSRHLMGLIDRVLASAGWRISQLDGFGVTRGPGSFTGIRIGMSTVMGLAQSAGRPVVGISALELLAWPLLQCHVPVCALIDARRREVYWGVYRLAGATVEKLVPEKVGAPRDVIGSVTDPCIFVGSGARLYREEIVAAKGEGARFAPSFQQFPAAAALAWLTAKGFRTQGQSAAALRPLYLRKSDAQIQRNV
ncbi:MAG: tRNA (adenosine(37)-N6)-threonylcarbamoyltransferase complex dimerization subunit type 1 TsaB [Desulfosarcinaceae bacterium]